MLTRKGIIVLLAIIILFLSTFGIAIYGINNVETYDIEFKGLVYEKENYKTLVNKNNHHIYIEEADDLYYILEIENDNAILKFSYNEDKYEIEKDGVIINGNISELKDDYNGQLKDYYILVQSYTDNEMIMDEFPEILIFNFLAFPPFIFGLILIVSIFRKRKNKANVVSYTIWTIMSLMYAITLSFLIFVVTRNIS